MKAILCNQFGSFDVLQYTDVAKPAPQDNEVVVRVHAASVNYNNVIRITGKPALARLMGVGFSKPKYPINGNDIAGVVEAVGTGVKQFRAGDAVYGNISLCRCGAFAEYVCVKENALVLKPVNLTFTEAAAVPEASIVALQALRDTGKIKAGQKVLIYGASGGIGTFAVQIAKTYGAEVTGLCSTKNLDLVRSLGADHVIDYTKENFAESGKLYDLIVATAGYRSIYDYKKALTSHGIYAATGGSMNGPHAMSQLYQGMFLGPLISMTGFKKMSVSNLRINQNDLIYMKELIESGKVKPVIDRIYPLSETAEAFRYYAEGHAKGKVVITVINQEINQNS